MIISGGLKVFEYIKSYYKVAPFIGQKIIHRGNPGIIVEDRGHYLGVNFDADKPGVVKSVHPTDEVIYGEQGVIRKMTLSQRRYQEYLRSDGYDSFGHWLRSQIFRSDEFEYYRKFLRSSFR